ncbi:hypothetical protein CCR75_007475 [Bremia lactucae]|uniref:Uncharacterized protein n=1 Tax=Bremia lactucae TaxID=4779 RepID=A0A976FL87_BRELC|nr:hypothetical protein CCR75_007475 [Bremia lactucae]
MTHTKLTEKQTEVLKNDECGCQTKYNSVNTMDDEKENLRKPAHFVQRTSQCSKCPTRGKNSLGTLPTIFESVTMCTILSQMNAETSPAYKFTDTDSMKLANRYNYVVVIECMYKGFCILD